MQLQVPVENGKTLSPPRCSVAHAWLSAERYAELKRVADLHRLHPDALAGMALDLIIRAGGLPRIIGRTASK